MPGPDLMSIGAFGMASGLSVPALRHYGEVGVLEPAFVDPSTGYRYYRGEQVGQARLIRALRGIDMPIDAIRDVIERDDEAFTERALATHRAELAARADDLAQMLCLTDQFIERRSAMPVMEGCRVVQINIEASSLPQAVAFYETAFEVPFDEAISSIPFGAYPSDEFFLLTINEVPADEARSVSRFGLLVDDLDAVHGRALAAGAVEIDAPADYSWKPRCSCVADPSGNKVDLYQG